MPAAPQPAEGSVFRVLRRPHVPIGMAAVTALFMGQFALFTYLRPFLETVTRVDTASLSLLLLVHRRRRAARDLPHRQVSCARGSIRLLIGMPLAMAAIAVALVGLADFALLTGVLLAGWGLIGTAAPVGWWTWLSKVLPDDAEAGGGLMVAVIQLAITLGASLGGLLVDASGYSAAFGASAIILAGSGLLAMIGSQSGDPRA